MKYVTIINGEQFEIEIDREGTLLVNGRPRHVDFLVLDESLYSILTDNQSLQAVINEERGQYSVLLEGRMYEGQVMDERTMLMMQRKGTLIGGSGELRAPMPGLLVAVQVLPGEQVEQGQTVAILESMKMQNELKAPIAGTVQTVHVEPGATVDKDALLMVILPPEE